MAHYALVYQRTNAVRSSFGSAPTLSQKNSYFSARLPEGRCPAIATRWASIIFCVTSAG